MRRTERTIQLYATVKETLDDMAVGRDEPKHECEVCEEIICIFCGVACAHCNAVVTCREDAETYENFTFCKSCNLAYCNDYDCLYEAIMYCSKCDRFCCYHCQNAKFIFCTICSETFCMDCVYVTSDHMNCDKCYMHFMCDHHNEAEKYLTYVYDDDERSEEYAWLCHSCLHPSPPKPPIEKRPQPQQKAPIEKPRSPSVSPRMSFSNSKDDTD